MRRYGFIWIVMAIMAAIDFYVYQALKFVIQGASPKAKLVISIFYWSISIGALLLLVLLILTAGDLFPRIVRTYVLATILGLFFAKIFACIFFLIDDIRRLVQWGTGLLFFRNTEGENISGDGISRSVFLSWLGLGVGGSLFGTLVYGFTNKYNYQLRKVRLSFDNLPSSFRGLKILHFSDVHSGSFTNKHAVEKGVEEILKEGPDLILFTGDLVNDRALEMKDYMDVFGRLKAPLGVYSTLGNHDYGDYVVWDSQEEKHRNLNHLKQIHGQLGWRLLMNEHVVLERNGDRIALIGIENWSAKARFPKHGKMNLAYPGAEQYPFKILMSHDPSHWDAEVRPKYRDIDLTLAGHTHGMQFGVEIPGFKWSPVQYVYRQWAGLYEEGKQKLYVNRGFGFIGYPGRVGILPEITVIELT